MDPGIAAAAVGASGFLSFKGNKASARAAQQVADYNAKLREQEAVLLAKAKADEEAQLRKNSERLIATQKVATAASGITMSGSPMLALADTYFATEKDALRIQFASEIEQTKAIADATLIKAEGNARASAFKTKAYATLLEAGGRSAQLLG
tara:strand:+ start:3094 stop:3546 length:453 start_codon:yes stop_codon:yes gene_type:complete